MKYYFRCPQCGNDEQFVKPNEQTSVGRAFSFGDSLVYSDYLRHRVQCPKCSLLFRRPALPSSPLAKFAGWIMGVTIVSFIVAMFFFSLKELTGVLPSNPIIAVIEEAITLQPRVAAYLLATLFALIFISCVIAAWVSNARFRKQLSKEYRVKPLSPRELAEVNRPKSPTPEELAREDREYRPTPPAPRPKVPTENRGA